MAMGPLHSTGTGSKEYTEVGLYLLLHQRSSRDVNQHPWIPRVEALKLCHVHGLPMSYSAPNPHYALNYP